VTEEPESFDPVGFALGAFAAYGVWRETVMDRISREIDRHNEAARQDGKQEGAGER
jgi:hypothetical protein